MSLFSSPIRLSIKKRLEKCPFRWDWIYKHIRFSAINWSDWQREFSQTPQSSFSCTILRLRECERLREKCENVDVQRLYRIMMATRTNLGFQWRRRLLPSHNEFIQLFKTRSHRDSIQTNVNILSVNLWGEDILRIFPTIGTILKARGKSFPQSFVTCAMDELT